MNLEVLTFLFVDHLIDPRFPKDFSEDADRDKIRLTLSEYFDAAMDSKGFDFQIFEKDGKAYVKPSRPHLYIEMKRKIVAAIESELFSAPSVFTMKQHPIFGRKCEVDSNSFFTRINKMREDISIDKVNSLRDDIASWGVDRFKSGLSSIYYEIGGRFNSDKWIDFFEKDLQGHASIVDLPNPNSIRHLDQDDPDVIAIKSKSKELISQLQAGNDLGNLSPEEASAAANEVRQIVTMFDGSRVRVAEAYERARATLVWIMSKAGEALAGAIAGALLTLIASYFGLSI